MVVVFLNVKRTTLPADVSLPVAAQTTGTKAADFFPGWTSPITSVFPSNALGGLKALCESNFDGRIAVKTVDQWRDGKITTFAPSVQILARLTASGRAIVCFYSSVSAGGFLTVNDVSGINPALPILGQNAPSNGTVLREIYNSSVGGATMVSRFGPSGTDVVANYSTTYTAGDTLTLILGAFRIAVMWKNTVIVDLPYDGWTHMEAGRWALAPTSGFGLLDSAMDFTPLTALPSVANSVPHPSDLSNPAARQVNLYDLGLKSIRQNGCSISAGSTTLTVPSTTPWRVGDQGIVETGQVAFTITAGVGNHGNGAFVTGCPYLSHDNLTNWATGNWAVAFTSSSSYTVTRPDSSSGGTGSTDCRYNNGITFQIMAGSTPFANGDTFTIACAASGETSTSTFDSKPSAGRNRTIGVGGVKPVHSLTQAQFDANTNLGYSADTVAYISNNTSGRQGEVVYVGPGGASYAVLTGIGNYYGNKSRPMALLFTVQAILSPTTLQIDTAASATTANATVWINCKTAIDRAMANAFQGYDGVTVRIPGGDYAVSGLLDWGTRTGWHLRGEGIDVSNLWQPRGVDGNFMQISHWFGDGDDEALCDFSIYSNDSPNGGFAKQILADPNGSPAIANLVTILTPVDTGVSRLKVVNTRGQALDISNGRNSFIRDCVALKTVPALNYSGWLVNMSDCNDSLNPCGHTGNTIINSWMQGSSETFSSENGEISGFTVVNGVISTNSSNNYHISDGTLTFTKNCVFNADGFDLLSTPAFSISSNQEHTLTVGGLVSNVDIIYEGYVTEDNQLNNALTIELSPSPGVVVDGTYNPLVADDGNRRGLISRPDWVAGNALNAAHIRMSSGCVLTLTNYRFVGSVGTSFVGQIYNEGGTITANNNVRDTGPSGSGTNNQTGNVTNATYDAL